VHKSKGASRSDWQTPESILLIVRDVLGGPVELDPATSPDNPTGALTFYTPKEDGLSQPWSASSIFLNPPWSRTEGVDMRKWLARAQEARANSRLRPTFDLFIVVSAAMNANWFHEYLSDMDAYFFPRGRVKYDPPDFFTEADAPGFDSVLCYTGTSVPRFLEATAGRGLTLRR